MVRHANRDLVLGWGNVHDRCPIQFPELDSLSSQHEVLGTAITMNPDSNSGCVSR